MIPSAAISFFCYEKVVLVFKDPEKAGGYGKAVLPFLGLFIGRLISTTFRTPFDVVKQRLQVQGLASA